MAEPKKKISKANTRSRRHQIKLSKPAMIYCEKCHSPKLRHHVCPVCGIYRGNKVFNFDKKIAE